MAKQTVRVVARIIAREDKVEQLQKLLLSLLEPTRREKGCVRYELLQSQSDPTDFTFVEEWGEYADLEAHLGSDHVQGLIGDLAGLTTEEPDIRAYRLLG